MIPREQPQPQPPQTIPVLGRPHHHKLFGWSVLPPPIKRWRTNTQITTPHTSHTHTHTRWESLPAAARENLPRNVGRSVALVGRRSPHLRLAAAGHDAAPANFGRPIRTSGPLPRGRSPRQPVGKQNKSFRGQNGMGGVVCAYHDFLRVIAQG